MNIEAYASRPRVKRVAVENFLMSLEGLTHKEAVDNCMLDARTYKWNHETVGAIREALVEYFK